MARALAETSATARACAARLSAASEKAARAGLIRPIAVGVTTADRDAEAALAETESRRAEEESRRAWATWDCVRCYRARKENPSATLFVDVRPRKAFERETVKGAINCPAAVTRGTVAEPIVERDAAGAPRAVREHGAAARARALVLRGGGGRGAPTTGTPGTLCARFTRSSRLLTSDDRRLWSRCGAGSTRG